MVNKAFHSALTVLLVVAIGASCSSSAKSGGTTTTAGGAGQAGVTASDSLKFSPDTLTVSVGHAVTWTNGGSVGHTVTFDSGPAFSEPLNAGATVMRTFTTAGTFAYHCSIHGPSMHGTIIVK
jgi:plastocyanin